MGLTSFSDETENGPVVPRFWTAGTSNMLPLSFLITEHVRCPRSETGTATPAVLSLQPPR